MLDNSSKSPLVAFIFLQGILKANYIAPNQNKKIFLEYYKDGIYDALEQIKKSAQEGLSEYPLKNQMKGKIIVAAEIGSLPINDIVRYKTIAIKNNYTSSITAKNLEDSQEYIIFDTFERNADAEYAIKRLSDYGVNAQKMTGGRWIKDPIIIRRIATDLKKGLLSNVPVKVIKIERTIYKTSSPKLVIAKNTIQTNLNHKILSRKKKAQTTVKHISASNHNKKILHALITLIHHIKQQNCYSVKEKYICYKSKKYRTGDTIKGFKIKDMMQLQRKSKKYFAVVFKGFENYKMIFRQPSCCENTQKQPTVQKTTTKKAKTIAATSKNNKNIAPKQQKKQAYYYLCDFSKIRTLFIPEVNKHKRISETDYSFLQDKKYKVLFGRKINDMVYFKASGFSPVGIKDIAWEQICKPSK